jgi:molecular chaperone GrpE
LAPNIDVGSDVPILESRFYEEHNLSEQDKDKDNQEGEAGAVAETVVEAPKVEEVDWKAKYYYLAADMENARKRAEREKENLLKYGSEKILGDLIDVVDNFERTVHMLRPDSDPKVKNIVAGLEMVSKMFLDSLKKHGMTQLESLGKDFDPNFHEAMGQEYAEGKRPNEVVKEFQKGYVLNGRLLRAAKVVVANDKQ